MKVNLIIFFNYNNKPDDDKEREISELLMSFSEFCENTEFKFQSLPRIGEYINAEPLLTKWIADKSYEKPCEDTVAFQKIYKGLRLGCFMVEEVYHSLDSSSIHCSDIEYQEIE